MAVTFNGISSGIDTQAIIKAMLDAQRKPITQLQSKRSGYNAQISDLGKITSKLGELSTLAKDMGETSKVLAFTIGVGDEDVLTAEANGETTAATYDINVSQLARAEKDRSSAFASSFSGVRAGVVSLKTAGDDTTYDVTIEEGDTLEDVVDKINGSVESVSAIAMVTRSSAELRVPTWKVSVPAVPAVPSRRFWPLYSVTFEMRSISAAICVNSVFT